jgi:hypothetical protein
MPQSLLIKNIVEQTSILEKGENYSGEFRSSDKLCFDFDWTRSWYIALAPDTLFFFTLPALLAVEAAWSLVSYGLPE